MGEVLGLLGPNGAGKSTTVKILTGLLPLQRGQVEVAGFDIATSPLEVKRRVGYVPESGALYDALTPDEYFRFISLLYRLEPDVVQPRVEELLGMFELDAVRSARMVTFSKGMRQKVLIASALLHAPDVIIFDEPLNGLDANAMLVFKELLRGLAAQGRTILFCSHLLDIVERLCPRIVIVDQGRAIAEGTPEAIARQTGRTTLEQAFAALTGARSAEDATAGVLSALEWRRVTTALARLLGVDPVQWKALVWVSFISDVRQMKGSGLRLTRAAAGSLGGALVSQLVYGAFCAALITVLPNVFATSTIYYSLLLATLGLALLVDFTSVVLSPDDHVQLAPRPVDSRTFFVARLTSVIGFSLMLTAPFALLPAVAYLFRDFGGSLAGRARQRGRGGAVRGARAAAS